MYEPLSYERLGMSTLRIFILQNLKVFFCVMLFMIGVAAVKPYISTEFLPLYVQVMNFGGIAAFVSLCLGLLIAWLDYTHYSVFLDGHDIKIRRGILNIEEVGFPYKQIREVRISRGPFEQVLGVSNLILTSDVEQSDSDITTTLPSLGEDLATTLQGEILKRAAVEEIRTSPIQS